MRPDYDRRQQAVERVRLDVAALIAAGAPAVIAANAGACPAAFGDGVCAALTPAGARSGGHALVDMLLVGWQAADELGRSPDKVRLARAVVLAHIPQDDFDDWSIR